MVPTILQYSVIVLYNTTIPHCSVKESPRVKEQFSLRNPFDSEELDREVIWAHSYDTLPSYMSVWWGEIEWARRA